MSDETLDDEARAKAERRAARASWPVKVFVGHPPEDPLLDDPEAGLNMMWQLTRDAWAMMGEPLDESRLLRHVVRVVRRGS